MKSTPRDCSALAQPKAFTLVELLTVIAIIGILAAIIIPTVGKVRAAARSAQCLSNLRELGVGFKLFAEDHRGRLVFNTWDPTPGGNDWRDNLSHYLNRGRTWRSGDMPLEPFNCPASETRDRAHFSRTYHYANDGRNFRDKVPPSDARNMPVFLSAVRDPSLVILAVDGWIPTNANVIPREIGSGIVARVAPRHGGRANVLYLDFHVASVDPARLPGASDELPYAERSGLPPWEF